MEATQDDRRQFPRLFFATDEGVRISLTPHGADGPWISCRLLDISAGGLCLSVARDQAAHVDEDMILEIREIEGPVWLLIPHGVKVGVRWLMTLPDGRYLTLGAQFLDLSPEREGDLREAIDGRVAALLD